MSRVLLVLVFTALLVALLSASAASPLAPLQLAQLTRDELEKVTPGDEVDFIDPETGAREFGTVASTDDGRELQIRNDTTGETISLDRDHVLELDDF